MTKTPARPPSYCTAIVDWHRHQSVIRAIRHRVFVLEQGVSEDLEIDPSDCRHTHALAFDADRNGIATGRLLADGRIGRMAVLEAWRRRGVGGAILQCLLDAARSRGLKAVALNAQVHARAFYAGRGFVERGGVFMEAGIEHIAMTRALR